MANEVKSQEEILQKLGIKALNPMQEEAQLMITNQNNVLLLSPTGTGKTLAFLLPIIEKFEPDVNGIQAIVIVPSRELAIQIEQVFRGMGTGYKSNAVYGGQSFSTDVINLKHPPAILIGTPGRVADHFRRGTFATVHIKTLVLDEFDKSLEIGFEKEMKSIIKALYKVNKRILTSATNGVEVPDFVGMKHPTIIDYLGDKIADLEIRTVLSPSKDKLETLVELLERFGNEPGIVFCNFKNTIEFVSNFLSSKNIKHGTFYGGMEQKDRERALIKFRNGTYPLIVATDLAARGIDVPEIKFIVHYQLPVKEEEFTHRNGRTARMNANGFAFVLHAQKERLPDFIRNSNPTKFDTNEVDFEDYTNKTDWTTIFISGGRKDKISKGDIAGLLMKQGDLGRDEVGIIELKSDCAFVSIPISKVDKIIEKLNNVKLKKRKVRIYEI